MKILLWKTVFVLFVGSMPVLIGLVLLGASESGDSPSIQVRYHDVLVQLAEVEVKAAAELNRKTPNAVAQQTMDRLRTNAAVARQLHERATRGYADMPEAHVLYADARAQLAESDYRSAVKLRERNPNSMPELKLERIRLSAELANLRVEMWKHPESLTSLVDQMQWEIDQMSQEILDLHKRVERLE